MTYQQEPQVTSHHIPPAPRKHRRRPLVVTAWISGGAVALIVIAAIFAPPRPSDTPTAAVEQAPAVTVTVTGPAATTVTVTAPPLPAATVTYTPPKPAGIGDGIYKVGPGGIDPGRYATEGGGGNCYYARLRNDSGDFNAIITNNNLDGPGSVTVKAGEFFQVRGSCEFRKA